MSTVPNFVSIWNAYTWALVFANAPKRRTLALGLQAIVDGMRYSGDWAALFAAVFASLISLCQKFDFD